jgi:hypothetical protein
MCNMPADSNPIQKEAAVHLTQKKRVTLHPTPSAGTAATAGAGIGTVLAQLVMIVTSTEEDRTVHWII